MRQFYNAFPKRHALRDQLSWTHYRMLLKVENDAARMFYLDECTKSNWSTRQLARQINSFYYQRLLSSQDKDSVRNEIQTLEKGIDAKDIIRDPYVLEFLGLDQTPNLYEKDIEQGLIDHLQKCNGSDGYLAWLDDVLDIRQTANFDMKDINYDIKIMDTPQEMQQLIIERNYNRNRSRILAGYCWNWLKQGKNDSAVHDIKIKDFEMSWNLGNSTTFAIDESSVHEAGCIHTSQGLEFDYVGVIIGEDLRYEKGRIITDFTKRASTDQSLKGIKSMYKKDPEKAIVIADEVIKNTYRTLMTRGMKGCYVYCVDPKLADYLRERL